MARISLTSAVLGTAFAAAIGLAPAAAAEEADEVSSRDTGRGSSASKATASDREGPYRPGPSRKPARSDAANAVPGWQNEALWARPGASGQFGNLPKPPIFALD